MVLHVHLCLTWGYCSRSFGNVLTTASCSAGSWTRIKYMCPKTSSTFSWTLEFAGDACTRSAMQASVIWITRSSMKLPSVSALHRKQDWEVELLCKVRKRYVNKVYQEQGSVETVLTNVNCVATNTTKCFWNLHIDGQLHTVDQYIGE